MRLHSLRGYEALQSSILYEAPIPTRPQALPDPALYETMRLYETSTARCLLQGLLCVGTSASRCLRRDAYSKVCFARGTQLQGIYSEVPTPRCLHRGAHLEVLATRLHTPSYLLLGVHNQMLTPRLSTQRCLLQGCLLRDVYFEVPTPRCLSHGAYAGLLTPWSASCGGLYSKLLLGCPLRGAYYKEPTPKCLLRGA